MGARSEQKQATRRRVLEAARDLFDEIGYEETTVRAIAGRAGVAVGSVFTTFTSKDDILSEIMLERLDALYAEIEGVMPHLRGATADRVRSFFALHYAFETRQLRLFLAHIAASYAWRRDPGTTPYGQNQRLQALLREVISAGIASGELRGDLDVSVLVETLMAAYAWNYRLAARDNAGPDVLTARMDDQIGLIFAGAEA